MPSAEIAIIGGGLAGAALAVRLGARATVIEREPAEHDKVCGEFLSREAVLHLDALGIDPLALGGHPIDRVRVSTGGSTAEVRLPFQAIGLSRRVLDAHLLARAEASGARVLRGRSVTGLVRHAAFHTLRLRGAGTLEAQRVVLATGKHDLRGHARRRGWQNDLVGFKLHLRPSRGSRRALDGAVELMLFRGGYAGLQRIEAGRANLCLLVRRSRLAALGGTWPAVLAAACRDAPLLGRRLAEAEWLQPRPLAIAGIPYGLVADGSSDLWRLGDQSAVIPSFTGDGMSIALHSAALAARSMSAGQAPDALQSEMRAAIGARVVGATLLSLGAVHRPLQPVAVHAARLWPALAAAIARATRVPDVEQTIGFAKGDCPLPGFGAAPRPSAEAAGT